MRMGFFNRGMYFSFCKKKAQELIKNQKYLEADELITNVLKELSGVVILTYHEIGFHKNPYTITPDKFRRQLALLREQNINIITYQNLLNGTVNYNEMNAIITFDDGRLGLYQHGRKAMLEAGCPYTLFITPGYQSNSVSISQQENFSSFMNWNQIKELQKDGNVDIGAHTYSHPDMSQLRKENIIEELQKSNIEIQEQLGIIPENFAYPYGKYSAVSLEETDSLYETVSTTNVGINYEGISLKKLRRTVILDMFTDNNFLEIINPQSVRSEFEKMKEKVQ